MRILYHHRTLGDGAEGIHIREMVKAFRAIGHVVKVIGPVGEVRPERMRKSRNLAWLKEAMPTLIYEFLEIGYTAYGFLKTAFEIGRFRPDFIYERYITFNAGPVLAGKLLRVPVCLEVNAPLALERSGEQDEGLTLRRIAYRMERWICSHASQTIVVSTPLKEYLESIGVPSGKCIVMPNGVDPIKFSPRPRNVQLLEKMGIAPGLFVVGFTGVVREWHGLDILITAMARLVANNLKICLLIVGDGPYKQQLETLIAQVGLKDSVHITGRVSHESVPDYISLFDIAISPRATFYASPMKVIEYMSLGKPVVVPHTQNFLDIVDSGVNGLTFEEGNPASLSDAIGKLYASADTCQQLGEKSRQKVEVRLNWRWNALEACKLMQALGTTE